MDSLNEMTVMVAPDPWGFNPPNPFAQPGGMKPPEPKPTPTVPSASAVPVGSRLITMPAKPLLVAPRTWRFWISTESVGRDGHVLDNDGAIVEPYLKTPTVLWAHDSHTLPPGRCVALERAPLGWQADLFCNETDLGEEINQAIERGDITSVSIGWDVEDWDRDTEWIGTGLRFKRWILLEISFVPVPALPDAHGVEEGRSEQPTIQEATMAMVRKWEEQGHRVPMLREWASVPGGVPVIPRLRPSVNDLEFVRLRKTFEAIAPTLASFHRALKEFGAAQTAEGEQQRTLSVADVASGGALVPTPMGGLPPEPQPDVPAEPAHAGTMIALYPPADVAQRLAVPGYEKPEDLHLTLAYQKDTSGLRDVQWEGLREGLKRLAGREPIEGTVGGRGYFAATEYSDDQDVFYASVDSPRLTELHRELTQALGDTAFEPENNHGFTPHITLAYLPPGNRLRTDKFEPIPIAFDHIAMVKDGGAGVERFPFEQDASGQDTPRAAARVTPCQAPTESQRSIPTPQTPPTKGVPDMDALQKTVARTRRLLGIETRAGKVLSAENNEHLRAAMDAMEEAQDHHDQHTRAYARALDAHEKAAEHQANCARAMGEAYEHLGNLHRSANGEADGEGDGDADGFGREGTESISNSDPAHGQGGQIDVSGSYTQPAGQAPPATQDPYTPAPGRSDDETSKRLRALNAKVKGMFAR